MWQVTNRTPFAALGYPVRDRDGVEHWAVAVRARFDVRPDGLVSMADAQKPVRIRPEYVRDDAAELRAESDFAPFRPRADVLFAGVAQALDAKPVRACPLRLSLGRIERRARAAGPRVLRRRRRDYAIEGPEDFAGIRLTWRASLGGADPLGGPEPAVHPANPVGRGWTARWGRLPSDFELAMPLIEGVDARVAIGSPLPEPYGFGPLQPAWQPRLAHAGTFDAAWRRERAPLPPLDFSEAFHQAAPPGQVYPDVLRGGEPVAVEGLHPDGPYAFRLPQVILDARTRIGADRVDHRFRLVSVTVDGTAKTVDMTWNAATPCPGRDGEVEGSVVGLRQMAGVAR